MADRSNIEWCDSTFNPWIGCTKISPACDNCYAEADFDKRRRMVKWGAGQARHRTTAENWRKPLAWNAKPFFECSDCGWRGDKPSTQGGSFTDGLPSCPYCDSMGLIDARRRVFCASLSDVFDNDVPPAWRAELFALIDQTPNLDWLLLTKRIGNVAKMIEEPGMQKCGFPPNVWLGATICNQAEADRDIPKLLAVPAAVRFVSMEPLLGPVDLTVLGQYTNPSLNINALRGIHTRGYLAMSPSGCSSMVASDLSGPRLDWVICGGESGPNARPMEIAWARSLAQQCKTAGVAFHMKQLGAQPRGWCAAQVHADPADREDDACDLYDAHECGQPCPARCAALVNKKGSDMAEWPEDLRVRGFPHDEWPSDAQIGRGAQ